MAAGLIVAWVGASLEGSARAQPAPAAAPVDPSPPAPAPAMDLFNAVDSWVREWRTPMDPSGQAPLHGASVTLRYEGSIVGRGVAVSPDPAGATGILIFAAKRAMDEARERLPIQRDALMEESLKAAAGRIAITVELAGPSVPISPSSWADLVDLVPPGLEGVAVRLGDRVEAMFPETMLCTGTDAAAAGRALVAKVSGDPTRSLKEPKELRGKHGVGFYRFRVTVVGQPAERKPPEFFTRGGRLARLTGLSEEALRIWAEKLAEHLWYQLANASTGYGIKGTYDPVRDVNETPFAGPAEQALVALAMWRYGESVRNAQINGHIARTETRKWVFDLLNQAHAVAPGETEPWSDPAAAAILWCVLDEASVAPWVVPKQSRSGTDGERNDPELVDLKRRCRDAIDRAMSDDRKPAPQIGAVIAWQLRQRFRPFPDPMPVDERMGWTPEAKKAAESFVSAEFSRVEPTRVVSVLPWLGWADVTRGGDRFAQAAPAWREMRSRLWQHQVKPRSPDEEDLAGGIVFAAGVEALPNWQSARPLAFAATMLGTPQFTEPAEVPGELAQLLKSLRYLRQLTAETAETHMYDNPPRAIGGVRASLFDQRMPPQATAMTLLVVCETLKSLEAIKQRQAQKKD